MMLAVYFPPFMKAFKLTTMDSVHWIYVLGLSLVPIVIVIIQTVQINSSRSFKPRLSEDTFLCQV